MSNTAYNLHELKDKYFFCVLGLDGRKVEVSSIYNCGWQKEHGKKFRNMTGREKESYVLRVKSSNAYVAMFTFMGKFNAKFRTKNEYELVLKWVARAIGDAKGGLTVTDLQIEKVRLLLEAEHRVCLIRSVSSMKRLMFLEAL